MTDKVKKRRKLSLEILAVFSVCLVISGVLFLFLSHFAVGIIEEYCFHNDITLDDNAYYHLDSTVLSVSFAVSASFFIVLFFALFGERIVYIRTITDGVDALQRGEFGHRVRIRGNNELTQLAEAVNYLSESEQKIKEKEKRLNEEREELIRTLSHDIRTPLTSMMSYTELLSKKEELTLEEQKKYLMLVSQKTAQIKELTDILLDGGRRELEYFEDARLLMEQLAEEFEEELEDDYPMSVTLSPLPAFAGKFDIREMRRIFDNLISNIRKYAAPSERVSLLIAKTDFGIVIRQKNTVRQDMKATESHHMGIHSIRRIAQHYGGTVETAQDDSNFEIMITLSNI